MVKCLSVLFLLVICASPALAQDVPQIELGFGYGNFELKDLIPDRHHGFTTHQTINLHPVFAIENYLGFYGFGRDPNLGKTELIAEIIGGRVSYRNWGPVLYATAGIGGGFLRFPEAGFGESGFGVKYGGGIDIPFKDFFAIKFDVSRMSFGLFEERFGGLNVSTGIVIKITQ